MKRYQDRIWLPLLLIAAVFIAYSNVYDFKYLYDDEFLIIKNRFLESFEYLGSIFTSSSTGGAGYADSFYRPMQSVFYLLTVQILGHETWSFHFLNISLHAINAVLVYVLGRRMQLKNYTALLVAFVWSLHPMHTEAVTYMSATADPLHALFILAGLNIAIPSFSIRRLCGAMGFFLLALLTKESAIVFPALLFTLVFFFTKRRFYWRSYLPTVPFWLVAFGYLASRFTFLNFNNDFSMYKEANVYTESILYRFFTFLATLPSYLQLIVWPQDLHIDHNFPVYAGFFMLPVILGTVMIALAALGSYYSRWIAWALLWFIASYVPQSGVLIPVNAIFLEHWMYLPSIGIFLSLGRACEYFPKARVPLAAGASLVGIILGILTYQQNWVWQNPTTLFSHILKFNPGADRVRHNLAMAYSDNGDMDQALEQYSIVLQSNPNLPQTYHNMGRIYLQKGDWEKAESLFLKAISLRPNFFPSYGALSELYDKKGDTKKAEEYRAKAKELSQ